MSTPPVDQRWLPKAACNCRALVGGAGSVRQRVSRRSDDGSFCVGVVEKIRNHRRPWLPAHVRADCARQRPAPRMDIRWCGKLLTLAAATRQNHLLLGEPLADCSLNRILHLRKISPELIENVGARYRPPSPAALCAIPAEYPP